MCEDTGPDDEGLAAFRSAGAWIPLVAGDRARVDSLRGIAREIARLGGRPVKLVRFVAREDLEVIG